MQANDETVSDEQHLYRIRIWLSALKLGKRKIEYELLNYDGIITTDIIPILVIYYDSKLSGLPHIQYVSSSLKMQ